jgi:predicted RNase H-like HicB family nuclease
MQQDGSWVIGWITEVPGVNSQATTKEELVENLRSALNIALEMNRSDALAAINGDYEEVDLQVWEEGICLPISERTVASSFVKVRNIHGGQPRQQSPISYPPTYRNQRHSGEGNMPRLWRSSSKNYHGRREPAGYLETSAAVQE